MHALKFLALFSTCTLVACGGGGGGGSGTPATQQSAEGVWVGTTTSSSGTTTPAIGLVLDSGEYFFGSGSDYSGVTFGNASVSGSTITSSNMRDYYPSLGLVSGTFTGSVTTGSSMNVNISETVNGTAYTGTGSLTFDPTYNEPSSLATIAGTYISPSAFTNSYTYTVDANGVLTGASTSCTFAGQLTVRNSAKNIYNLSLTTGSTPGHVCAPGARTLQGAATYVVMPGRSRRALVLIGMASASSTYYWVTAAGEKQ
ncbi:hypothetical protein [Limnohabitans sp. TS-CS-82]|uniref:hypothetical protein n=1 Tax=Limnohabitans sp. TS-CS-82 TaxID=2094193 RepID=UPI0011B0A2A4|nr:hypothetical protein [Limnohabitans sp. TS-CS-82]